ncbi:GH92 family glycosyl hydrolase [Ohtaekwangia sp.]|uniref:GH92 family glycosyl hydrolase n=1 Tax=Ohtaekwangia sp. TaxID=2066019 RepID=UPI002FDCB8F9
MKKNINFMFVCAYALFMLVTACKEKDTEQQTPVTANLTQYVDPYIGSGFHGHVFVGANVPFGAVQLGPTQLSEGWDWCSGYHYSDSVIIGFSHTHLSGTGIGELGDVLMMPVTGPAKITKGTVKSLERGYASLFSHQDEKVKPGYYSVKLKRYNINVELTTSERAGFHRYTFPETQDKSIVIDLKEGIGWDLSTETSLEKLNDSTLIGYRYSKGWAADQRLFFAIQFNKPVAQINFFNDTIAIAGNKATGIRVKGVAHLTPASGNIVLVKVGISPVSTANALQNIAAEIPHWNFDKTAQEADAAWNKALNKVQIKTADEKQLRKFYTALYHTMIAPSIFNDHNGDYRGTDKQVYHDTTFTNLTTFSLWDTYRSAHSLFTLLQPERVNDMINTMLKIHEQQGKLPIWHLMGNETNTMPGNSAFPVMADAYLKGFRGFDGAKVLQAMKASVMRDERGLKYVREQGYIPADAETETVAKGLEYSIDDWCAAQLALALGNREDYEFFSKRALNYRHYFDTTIHFMRGRVSDTEWRTPFSPFVARHMKDDFSEGNAWQYTWLVPHDVEGLIKLMGGEGAFLKKLDSLFIVKGNMGNEASNDITGLIGQYAHGNEPSHHIPYLYAYAGQPWKTAEKVRYILDSLYTDKPDGLCGNEDVGQMSAWYVFSAMGFYPVNPANGMYIFGSPSINSAIIQLPNDKKFTIEVKNNTPQNIYIQQLTLNGKPYTKTYISYSDIMNGGELIMEMGSKPGTTWGIAPEDRAFSVKK